MLSLGCKESERPSLFHGAVHDIYEQGWIRSYKIQLDSNEFLTKCYSRRHPPWHESEHTDVGNMTDRKKYRGATM